MLARKCSKSCSLGSKFSLKLGNLSSSDIKVLRSEEGYEQSKRSRCGRRLTVCNALCFLDSSFARDEASCSTEFSVLSSLSLALTPARAVLRASVI